MIRELSWHNDLSTQNRAVEDFASRNDICLTDFILPEGKKDCWFNCARILERQNDEKIAQYSGELFAWLQDMNWPGAEIIAARLKKLPLPVLRVAYERALLDAANDEEWLFFIKEEFDEFFGF